MEREGFKNLLLVRLCELSPLGFEKAMAEDCSEALEASARVCELCYGTFDEAWSTIEASLKTVEQCALFSAWIIRNSEEFDKRKLFVEKAITAFIMSSQAETIDDARAQAVNLMQQTQDLSDYPVPMYKNGEPVLLN